jgi:plastocyanin
MRAALVLVLVLVASRAYGDGGTVAGTVKVNRPAGVEAGPILVYVVGFTEPPPADAVAVVQKDRHFAPDLVGVTAGQSVAFPNADPFLHNVFSPTEARRFDLGSYEKGATRSRKFPDLGVIDVYCNIHPEMSATIVVLPNLRHAIAKPDGSFAIDGVRAGTWTVFAYSRRAARPATGKVTVRAGETATIELSLDEIQRELKHDNKFGEKYRDPKEYAPSYAR